MKEIKSPLEAIKEHCKQCSPEGRVKDCTAGLDSKYPCELYPFRFGHNPYSKRREMTEKEKEAATLRMKKARESKKCNI